MIGQPACQGVKPRRSHEAREHQTLLGVEVLGGDQTSVATLRNGESDSFHSVMASSIGIRSGSVWNWTRKSKTASFDLRWSASASKR